MRRDYADGSVLIGDEFWGALYKDMLAAKARVIIYSPFVGMWQLQERFDKIFDQIMVRQVRICVILQPPYRKREVIQTDEQFSQEKLVYEECVAWLQKKGIHVTFRPEIHEKLVVIDEHILWDGSKNVLAQGKSSERMNRFTNRQRVIDAVIDHKLADCTDCQKLFDELGFASIPAQISRLRKLRGKSQRLLAKASHMHQSNIGKFESGQADSYLSTVVGMTTVLGAELVVIPTWLKSFLARYLAIEHTQPTASVSTCFAPPLHLNFSVSEPSIEYISSVSISFARAIEQRAPSSIPE